MKTRLIGYWIATALTAFVFLAGGAADLSGNPAVTESMNKLGYAAYVAYILGVWKILGGIAVLLPGTARLKEWAYAGMVFDLTGAAASHAFVGEMKEIAAPLIITGIVVASWALRPASRKLQALGDKPTLSHDL